MRTTSLLCATLLTFALLGCGGGDDGDGAAAGGADAGATTTVDPAQAATISGTVRFTGTPAAGEPIDMADEPTCAEKHPQGARTTPAVVNANGTLRNVFVYVKEGLPEGNYAGADEPTVLDQNGCVYVPHVIGIRAGRDLTIRNSDGILHNINAQASVNRSFNMSQPTTMDSRRSFSRQEVMVPVRCDVHGWMEAYIGVVDHPYFAVTGEDGSYRLANLPPGTYTVEAWHERYGTQTRQVTVAAQETQQAEFSYDASMAATAVVPLGTPIDLHASHGAHASGTGR